MGVIAADYKSLVYTSSVWGARSLVFVILVFGGCAWLDPRQVDPPAPGIARTETIIVDGLPEHLLIRGNDPVHNPVLLFLHGGPGFPDAPFRQVYSSLERDFTVVYWDQRGAGYSYFKNIPLETMRVEQFVRETLIVAHHLCGELRQPKLYLLGHSWGTLPAILAAAREPQLFQAYIAVSQLVDVDESERRLADRALRYAQEKHAVAQARQLRALGPPPYLKMSDQDRAAELITSLFPQVTHQATDSRLALMALESRYYPLPEILRANRSYQFSRDLLDPQLHGYDLRRLVPRIDVPIYFFVGEQDSTFGVSIQQEYYRRLIAPHGKHFMIFDESTHWPHLEQPGAFVSAMRQVRTQTWTGATIRAF